MQIEFRVNLKTKEEGGINQSCLVFKTYLKYKSKTSYRQEVFSFSFSGELDAHTEWLTGTAKIQLLFCCDSYSTCILLSVPCLLECCMLHMLIYCIGNFILPVQTQKVRGMERICQICIAELISHVFNTFSLLREKRGRLAQTQHFGVLHSR